MNRQFRLISLVVSAMLLFACTSNETKIARYLEDGDKYYAEAKYKEAIIEYKNVIQLNRANVKALRQLGFAYYTLGEYQNALPYLMKAKESDLDNLDLRLKTAHVLILAGKIPEAREELNFILEKDPQKLDALIYLADIAGSLVDVEDVLARLREIQVSPQDRQRYNMALGQLYGKKGDISSAENAFMDALKGEQDLPQGHLALGYIAMAKKDTAQAEQEFKAAAALLPEASPGRMTLADFYLTMKNREAATNILNAAIEKDSEFLPALYRLARLSLEDKKFDECTKYLDTVFKKNPADLEGRLIRAQMSLASGNHAQAVSDLQDILKAKPNIPFVQYLLGLAFTQAGDMAQARAKFAEAVKLDPNLKDATLKLAAMDIQAGAYDNAKTAILRVLAKDPGNLEALLLFSEAVQSKEDVNDGLKRFKALEGQYKESAPFQLALGVLYLKANDLSNAESSFKNVLAKYPSTLR